MREYCIRLRGLVEKGSTEDDLETQVEIMMEEVNISSFRTSSSRQIFHFERDIDKCKMSPL